MSSAATSREELEKLTVPQLKERLRGRKLPLSGTKAELVSRLIDDIVSEDKLLGGLGGGQAHGAPSDTLDLDTLAAMDALLGEGGSDTHSEEKGAVPTAAAASPTKTATSQSSKKLAPKILAPAPDEKEASAGSVVSTGGGGASSAAEDKKVRMTAVGRMGLPISAESEAKAKRAARFGSTDESPAAASTPAAVSKVGNDADALSKRLARFGPSSSSSTTTPDANGSGEKGQNKVGLSAEDGSKMLERAKRFGLPLGSNGAVAGEKEGSQQPKEEKVGGRVVGGMVSDELLSKRAKRFANEPLTDDERKKQSRRDRFGS